VIITDRNIHTYPFIVDSFSTFYLNAEKGKPVAKLTAAACAAAFSPSRGSQRGSNDAAIKLKLLRRV
jgi:hypothetical protein